MVSGLNYVAIIVIVIVVIVIAFILAIIVIILKFFLALDLLLSVGSIQGSQIILNQNIVNVIKLYYIYIV